MAARARRQPDDAELRGYLRRQAPAVDAAVLQPGVVVVDGAQRNQLLFQALRLDQNFLGRRTFKIYRDPPWYYPVHEVAVAEKLAVGPQQVFLEARELRQPEGQAAIVAEVAEVAEVVGDALALEQQGAQP